MIQLLIFSCGRESLSRRKVEHNPPGTHRAFAPLSSPDSNQIGRLAQPDTNGFPARVDMQNSKLVNTHDRIQFTAKWTIFYPATLVNCLIFSDLADVMQEHDSSSPTLVLCPRPAWVSSMYIQLAPTPVFLRLASYHSILAIKLLHDTADSLHGTSLYCRSMQPDSRG